MAEGTNTYQGLAVPLQGNFEITAQSTSYDVMTLTQAAAGASDFIVCQTQNGTEMFVVEDDGKMTVGGEGVTVTSGGLTVTAGDATITAGDVVVGDGYCLRWAGGALMTTVVTTGLTAGDFFPMGDTSVFYLAFKGATSVLFTVAMTDN